MCSTTEPRITFAFIRELTGQDSSPTFLMRNHSRSFGVHTREKLRLVAGLANVKELGSTESCTRQNLRRSNPLSIIRTNVGAIRLTTIQSNQSYESTTKLHASN